MKSIEFFQHYKVDILSQNKNYSYIVIVMDSFERENLNKQIFDIKELNKINKAIELSKFFYYFADYLDFYEY